MSPDAIQIEQSGSRGRYFFRYENGQEAELTFSNSGEELLVIDYVFVPPAFRGGDEGVALIARAVEDARKDGRKIVPVCTYAAAQFRRHREWSDVLRQ